MTRTLRQICSLLMLLALLTASALPAGYMPNLSRAQAGDAEMAPIVLCTATGYQTVFVPKDQAPARDEAPVEDAHRTHQPCPYAPANAAADVPKLPAVKAPFAYQAVKIIYAAAQNLRAKLPQKHTRAQAPPRI